MPFLKSSKLPSGEATRRNFRQYRRIYRKLPCNGDVYVYNGTGSAHFCPFLGASGIRINNDVIALTKLRNPVSYLKRIKLYNQLLDAVEAGITIGTQSEAEVAQTATRTASSVTKTDLTEAFTFKTPNVDETLNIRITSTGVVTVGIGTYTHTFSDAGSVVLTTAADTEYTITPSNATTDVTLTVETSVAISALTADDTLIAA